MQKQKNGARRRRIERNVAVFFLWEAKAARHCQHDVRINKVPKFWLGRIARWREAVERLQIFAQIRCVIADIDLEAADVFVGPHTPPDVVVAIHDCYAVCLEKARLTAWRSRGWVS